MNKTFVVGERRFDRWHVEGEEMRQIRVCDDA